MFFVVDPNRNRHMIEGFIDHTLLKSHENEDVYKLSSFNLRDFAVCFRECVARACGGIRYATTQCFYICKRKESITQGSMDEYSDLLEVVMVLDQSFFIKELSKVRHLQDYNNNINVNVSRWIASKSLVIYNVAPIYLLLFMVYFLRR